MDNPCTNNLILYHWLWSGLQTHHSRKPAAADSSLFSSLVHSPSGPAGNIPAPTERVLTSAELLGDISEGGLHVAPLKWTAVMLHKLTCNLATGKLISRKDSTPCTNNIGEAGRSGAGHLQSQYLWRNLQTELRFSAPLPSRLQHANTNNTHIQARNPLSSGPYHSSLEGDLFPAAYSPLGKIELAS
ncbi:Hypothetical predicted protein [Pelobates cultripes]|uniref:Uncharacterized protein n=1 Tax=Pelobates cultripes TaxID=61616 RepID=A0AAD1SF38_PELCU|nr:Hypothetical predicted protein [Pelobates cultripes]